MQAMIPMIPMVSEDHGVSFRDGAEGGREWIVG